MSHRRRSPRSRNWLAMALVAVASSGCAEEGTEQEPVSLEEREAPCLELQPETDCGTITRAEGCDDLEGASPSDNAACGRQDDTDAVTECVLSSLAAGASVVFTLETVVVSSERSAPIFAVAADGSGWTRTNDSDAICTYHGVETRGATSLEGCTEIDGVVERLEAASPALECTDYSVCDE